MSRGPWISERFPLYTALEGTYASFAMPMSLREA